MKKPNLLFLEFPHFLQELNKTVSLSLVSAHYISFLCPHSFPQTHGNYRAHAHTLSFSIYAYLLTSTRTLSRPGRLKHKPTPRHLTHHGTLKLSLSLSLSHTHTHTHTNIYTNTVTQTFPLQNFFLLTSKP